MARPRLGQRRRHILCSAASASTQDTGRPWGLPDNGYQPTARPAHSYGSPRPQYQHYAQKDQSQHHHLHGPIIHQRQPVATDWAPRPGACWNCLATGHKSRDCTNQSFCPWHQTYTHRWNTCNQYAHLAAQVWQRIRARNPMQAHTFFGEPGADNGRHHTPPECLTSLDAYFLH